MSCDITVTSHCRCHVTLLWHHTADVNAVKYDFFYQKLRLNRNWGWKNHFQLREWLFESIGGSVLEHSRRYSVHHNEFVIIQHPLCSWPDVMSVFLTPVMNMEVSTFSYHAPSSLYCVQRRTLTAQAVCLFSTESWSWYCTSDSMCSLNIDESWTSFNFKKQVFSIPWQWKNKLNVWMQIEECPHFLVCS